MQARVVESVDTRDLKSLGHWPCGFKSRLGYKIKTGNSVLAPFPVFD